MELFGSGFARNRIRRAAGCLLGLALSVRAVHAEDKSRAPGDAPDNPSAHFRRAVQLLSDEDRKGALDEFRIAERLAPTATTLWNIVVLEIDLGMTRDAHRDLVAYRQLASGMMSSERTETVRTTLEQLEKKLTRVRLELSPKEGVLLVDDVDGAGTVWLAPGNHVLEGRALGYIPRKETITLDAGTSTDIRWSLVPILSSPSEANVSSPPLVAYASSEPRASPDRDGSRGSGRKWAAYGVGAAGIAIVGVGAYFGLDTLSKRHESDQHCLADDRCDARGVELNQGAYRSAIYSDIGFATGGILIGAAAYLLLSSPAPAATQHSARGARFRAVLVPTPFGVVAAGTM